MSHKREENDLSQILLKGDYVTARELLRGDPDLINQKKGLVLFVAARTGSREMLEFVCDQNPVTSFSNYAEMAMLTLHEDTSALIIYMGYLEKTRGSAFLKNRLRGKHTALSYAASVGNVAAFEILIRYASFTRHTKPPHIDVAAWAFNKNYIEITTFILQQYFSAYQISMFLKIRLGHFRLYKNYPRIYALASIKLVLLNHPPDVGSTSPRDGLDVLAFRHPDKAYNVERDIASIVVSDEIDDTCLLNWTDLDDPSFNREGLIEVLRRSDFEAEFDGSLHQTIFILRRYVEKTLSIERSIIMRLIA